MRERETDRQRARERERESILLRNLFCDSGSFGRCRLAAPPNRERERERERENMRETETDLRLERGRETCVAIVAQ